MVGLPMETCECPRLLRACSRYCPKAGQDDEAAKNPDGRLLVFGQDHPCWRNAAQWARNSRVNERLLKKDSPRGIWEISDKGTQYLKQNG